MNPRDNLATWRLIRRLAETDNMTRAASEEKLELSHASRLIRSLEQTLNIALLDRNTRPVKLIESVRPLIPRLTAWLIEGDRLMDALASIEHSKTKILKLGIPSNIPRQRALNLISSFVEKRPELQVELLSSATHEEILSGQLDAGFLSYMPGPEVKGLVVRPVLDSTTFMVATPSYLERRGVPRTPLDLNDHRLILCNGAYFPTTTRLIGPEEFFDLDTGTLSSNYATAESRQKSETATLAKDGQRHGPRRFYGDTFSCLQATLDGIGIAVDLATGIIEPYLEDGRLVPVLLQWHRPMWHKAIAARQDVLNDPVCAEFLKAYADVEEEGSNDWIRLFKEWGVDGDAILKRRL